VNTIRRNATGVGIRLALNKCIDLFVVKTTGALDDTLADPDILIHNTSGRIGLENDADSETVLSGNEGTKLSGNTGRQHVHDTIDQINSGTTLLSFAIHQGVALDKVSNVSNVNTNLDHAISKLLDMERILEGLAVGGIYCEDGLFTEVTSGIKSITLAGDSPVLPANALQHSI